MNRFDFQTWRDERSQLHSKAGVKWYNVVGATLLFSPKTSLLLLNKAEINNALHQHVVQFDPSQGGHILEKLNSLSFP